MRLEQKKSLLPNQYLIIGFCSIIAFGSLLLFLPFSHRPGIHIHYLDALFTSVSAVCVTGLVTLDVAATFNLFGRTVIALLILLGGLGFASFVLSFSMLLGWNIGISKRSVIREAYNLGSLKGTTQVVRTVAFGSLIFQVTGTFIEYFVFRKNYPPLQALGHAAFNAISAFNNAGFDLMGGYKSLTGYRGNIVMNLTTAFLIIIGGTGFFVLSDVARNRKWKKLSMHSRIVLLMNTVLIVLGTLVFLFLEHTDVLSSFFQSVTARTAGFNTIDIGKMSEPGQFFLMILMFIGASPGSTGGGIKTTTAFAILISLGSMIFRREPSAFQRRISNESIIKAFQVFLLALLVVILGVFLIAIAEAGHFSFLQISFEGVSAFATVGLSTGITPFLGPFSKVILMFIMFIGRLGPFTIASSLRAKESVLKYVDEPVFIG
ncbi:potassium transporter TrkG [uncultured Sphaerochaeta sp.]|uniref:TrkH family potassium uptake protein n=1 Tax=uncultured Sphaerochaeta sp. TaxID=886478 RepID=UPI002A0A39EB|nr:potassium transporter TrkG [uncultured Sphaerochaeta sp.]